MRKAFINRKIWFYWHQGFDQAPELVVRSIELWQNLNPKWQFHLLDWDHLNSYLNREQIQDIQSKRKLNITGSSDLIRLELLKNFGGIWIDSTVYPLQPLNEWLNLGRKFFAFSNPGKDRLLSTWFMAASEQSVITSEWQKRAFDYWNNREWGRRPYYWCHYLFNDLYQRNPEVGKEWDERQLIEAKGPHFFAPYKKGLFQHASQENIHHFESQQLPLVKLTYKCLAEGYPKGTMIDYLLNQR